MIAPMFAAGCGTPQPEPDASAERALPLLWIRGEDAETWDMARAGLWWSISLLGGAPADEAAITVIDADADRVRYTLDLDAAGFSEDALGALDLAVAPLLRSDEREVFGGIDTGRLLMRTLYSPWRYYAITGACDTLPAWSAPRLDGISARFAVTDSLLVPGDREIELRPDPARFDELAFQAAEGEGSLADGSFEAAEHEVLDLMANGQQRFALYGRDGALIPSSTASEAGQPGRCMWCHEDRIQIISAGNADLDGYLTLEQFEFQLSAAQALMDQVRTAAASPVPWSEREVHAYGERLTEHFLSPSADRLSREWGVPEATVAALLAALPTHESEEYPELPPLYRRADVDAALSALLPALSTMSALDLAPQPPAGFTPAPVLPSARELDPADWGALDGAAEAWTATLCGP